MENPSIGGRVEFPVPLTKDLWIPIGAANFLEDLARFVVIGLSDYVYSLLSKRKRYFEMVRLGQDSNPLTTAHFAHEDIRLHNKVYNLKSNLVFWIIGNNLTLDDKKLHIVHSIFYNVAELCSVQFLRLIKKNFAIKKIKGIVMPLVETSGAMKFTLQYKLYKKEGVVKMYLSQSQMAEDYFRRQMDRKIRQEKNFLVDSAGKKVIEQARERFHHIVSKYESLLHPNVGQEGKRLYLVNKKRNTLKLLKFNMQVVVTEVTDTGDIESVLHLKMSEGIAEARLQLKSKLKQIESKKAREVFLNRERLPHLNGNLASGTSVAESVTQTANQTQTHQKSTANASNGESLTTGVCFVLDRANCFLMETWIDETQETLLAQFKQQVAAKEDLNSLYVLVRALRATKSFSFVNLACSMLKKKDLNLYIRLELLDVLRDVLRVQDPLVRVQDVLLHLVDGLKVEPNGTLRPNNFAEKENFEFLLKMVELLFKYDKALNRNVKEFQKDSEVEALVLRLLQNNDNSMNQFDDSYYQAQLLKYLLGATNARFFDKILGEVLRFLKIAYYNPSRKHYILAVIFQKLSKFVVRNLKAVKHHALAGNGPKKFSILVIHSDSALLKEIATYLRRLKSRYKAHPALAPSIYLHKLSIKKHLKGYRFLDLLVYSLKHSRKIRNGHGTIVANRVLQQVVQYFSKKRKQISTLQTDMTPRTSALLNDLLWEQMTCQVAHSDPLFTVSFQSLYQLFFGEFVPGHLVSSSQNVGFEYDPYWLSLSPRFELDTFILREKKFVTFKHLSLQKKKKNGQVVTPPRNHKYNIRDLLLQNFKINKESFTKKNMAKHIVAILLTEKYTRKIESETIKEAFHDHTMTSIKNIKNKLQRKNDDISLSHLRQQLIDVFENYRSKHRQMEYLNMEVFQEYKKFIYLLVGESEKILQEKEDKEEEQKKQLRIKFKIQ